MLHGASLIHASGTFIVPYWARGGGAAVLPGFQPDTYLRAIADWRPTQLNLVPTMLGMLLDHPAAATADFSSVQTVFCGGSRRRMLGQRPRSWSRAPARWRR